MAVDQAIMREYLVALGFKINDREHKKFDATVLKSDVRMTALGKTAVGVATSIVTFTTLFAKSMERLYYSSRYANSTAGNLRALEFGAQQIGLKAGAATAGVTGMVAALRANPGLVGLLTGKFGIQVAGRDSTAVFNDLIRVLRAMPPYIGQQFAALFNISPEDLFNLGLGLEKMEKAEELQRQMAKDMGVDMNEAARMGMEYSNTWREITTHAGLFVDLIGISLMKNMKELAGTTHDLMNDWAKIVQDINRTGSEDFWKRMREGLGLSKPEAVQLTPEAALATKGPIPHAHSRMEWLGIPRMIEDWRIWRAQRDQKAGVSQSQGADAAPAAAPPSGDQQAKLRALEKKYSLPDGVLDRMWYQESGRGTNVVGPLLKDGTRAEGDFQFIPKTAKAYGVTDPYNFDQSSEAAARMMSERLKARGGDLRMALADYNWGAGNVNRYGLGAAPKETRDYMDAVGGAAPSVTQQTTIHIHGAEKPHEAGDAVYEAMESVNAETLRNFIPKVR